MEKGTTRSKKARERVKTAFQAICLMGIWIIVAGVGNMITGCWR